MQQSFEAALEISEYLLEKTGDALLQNDVEEFVKHFTIPNEIQTFEGRRIVKTRADMHSIFRAVRAYYLKTGVTDMVRHCVEASFTSETTVVAMHETRLITGNIITRTPFPTLSVLRFNGTCWQIASSSYAIDDEKEHAAALLSAGEEYPPRPVKH